jgi:outer membrane protein assembly factor BamD (BamD/ComL family)
MQPATAHRSVLDIVLSLGSLVVCVGLVGWVMFLCLKRSKDPGQLITKWLLSLLVLTWMFWKVIPMVARGGYEGAFLGIPLTAVGGLLLAIIWRHSIAGWVAKPFGALYDGGDAEIEPQAYYSIAESRRKRGHYNEAIAEIRKQLDKFPTDFTGQMLLAEIQAENLNDLPGAEITIQRLCRQPGHAPRNVAYAFNTLADWHLKYSVDRDAARADLQRIVDLFPESELALLAEQRIGHLAGTDQMLAAHDRPHVHLPEGVKNIGLLQSSQHLTPTSRDPAEVAGEYVRHLEQHPQDTEAREKLAVIYADHFERLDLAADQLQQLIDQPNQPARQVVHWVNLLADLQIRHGAGYDAVWQTLAQIIEHYPNQAAADVARNRMDLLKLELKAKTLTRSVKLGDYEQNIGLKQAFRDKT